MIKKVTGGIVSLSSIALIIFLVLMLLDDGFYDMGEALGGFGFFLLAISGLHFTITSKFWTTKLTVLDSLDRENDIIKKQIEKHELLKKLDSLKGEKK